MNKKPILTMPLKPWQEGLDSKLGDECPYPLNSRESLAWSAGRIEGQALVNKQNDPPTSNMKAVFFKYAGDEDYSRRIGVADCEKEAVKAVKYHCQGVDNDPYHYEVKDRKGGFYVTLERVL